MSRLYTKSTSQIFYLFFDTSAFWPKKSPLKVHFVRHFDSAIFVVTSRVESLPIGSQKHLWDLYKHVCCLVSYKNIFLVLTLVKRCVVGSCNNSNKTGHSTHFFPKEERIRRQWINFVQIKRADFLEPTEHSIICGAHFANECFEDDGMVKMGLKDKRSNLKTGSVPTIQPQRPKALPEARKRTMKSEEKEIPATASQTPGKRSRTSRAVHKLSVSRVSKPM